MNTDLKHAKGLLELYTCGNVIATYISPDGEEHQMDSMEYADAKRWLMEVYKVSRHHIAERHTGRSLYGN